jgi:hypothetical protein
MWYDKYDGLPPRGSPLESLFLLVFLQRQEATLLSARALVQSTLPEGKAGKAAIDAFQKYADTMFPFIKSASKETDMHERLREFVKHPVKIDLRPIRAAAADHAKQNAALKHSRLKPQVPGIHAPNIPGKKRGN